jgi:endonuclease YncB( thermonuclease family)
MNQRHPPKPRRGSPLGLTPQQIIILIVVALLGITALALAVIVLFPAEPPTPPAALEQPSLGGLDLPPTWTPAALTQPAPLAEGAVTRTLPPLPAACAQTGSEASQGTVSGVIDSSTIEVQVAGSAARVGYAGIVVPAGDPQIDQAAAQQARELLENQAVVLVKDVSEEDSAGRQPRYVFAGSRFINYEMVRLGLAFVQTRSPDQACAAFLAQAEQQARANHLGIWKPTPVPTRTFVPFVTLEQANPAGCDCSKRYECSNFSTHEEAQSCFNLCNDYSSKLDDDHDGIACENLP